MSIYQFGLLCCARPGCRCEFQTYHDMLQHMKQGICGAIEGRRFFDGEKSTYYHDPLIRRLPFSRKREDMQEILYQRRFASGRRMSSPENSKVESGDKSQRSL